MRTFYIESLRKLINLVNVKNVYGFLYEKMSPNSKELTIEKITESYGPVISTLRFKPARQTEYEILVENSEWDGFKFITVGLMNKDENGDRISISFVPWGELIEAPIYVDKEFSNEKPECILAEILWEITFYGITEEKQQALIESWELGK